MQIEPVWIVLAVVLVIIELWAINRVRKSAGKGSNKGVWIIAIVFLCMLIWASITSKRILRFRPVCSLRTLGHR